MNMINPLKQEDIRKGLEQEAFFLLFQPRRDVYSRKISSVEALVRWRHPSLGVVAPNHFIDYAEQTGLIVELGDFVLRKACETVSRLKEEGIKLDVSVNVSPLQLSPVFPKRVSQLLEANDLPAERLELEVTEGVLLSKEMRFVLDELIERGVGIAIDDFGTGHSSLAYLRQFAARTLKVDGSFLEDLPGDLNGCMLLNSIIKLGHGLGMSVVCEGVERQEQMELAELAQADQLQGYAIAKPLSLQELLARFFGATGPVSTEAGPRV